MKDNRVIGFEPTDAFAVLSGASLTTVKAYLMGKFARMCRQVANTVKHVRRCLVEHYEAIPDLEKGLDWQSYESRLVHGGPLIAV